MAPVREVAVLHALSSPLVVKRTLLSLARHRWALHLLSNHAVAKRARVAAYEKGGLRRQVCVREAERVSTAADVFVLAH